MTFGNATPEESRTLFHDSTCGPAGLLGPSPFEPGQPHSPDRRGGGWEGRPCGLPSGRRAHTSPPADPIYLSYGVFRVDNHCADCYFSRHEDPLRKKRRAAWPDIERAQRRNPRVRRKTLHRPGRPGSFRRTAGPPRPEGSEPPEPSRVPARSEGR